MSMVEPVDRLTFGTWPTPIEPAPRLAKTLGLGADDLWIKRDDLIGLGGGGNKVRKLEYTCAQAVAVGATTLITTGAPQSNHARLTAAAAARLGMDCVLVLEGQPETPALGNPLLNAIVGAKLVWAPAATVQSCVSQASNDVRAAGGVPFVIPFGGSTSFAARGYLDCAHELEEQLTGIGTVVVAVGSGGTMAGLVAGLGPDRVLGVASGAVDDAVSVVSGLLAGMDEGSSSSRGLRVLTSQVGAGYAHVTAPVRHAIRLAARTEGIFLDPIYTGRAMAGLIALCKQGGIAPGPKIVFMHTGGLPGLLAHPELAMAE